MAQKIVAGRSSTPSADPVTVKVDQILIARNARGSNHDFAVHCIECSHDALFGEFPLNSFAELIGVAHRQRGRHPFGRVQRIANLNEDLAAQVLRAR